MRHLDQALTILGAQARSDARIRRRITADMRFIRRLKNWKASGKYGVRTKTQKEAAQKLEVALKRLQDAIENPDLPIDLRPQRFDKTDLDFLRNRALEVAYSDMVPDASSPAKRFAAEAAAKLLSAQGLPVRATRRGPFCRLAAILYGDPSADLFHHCRQVRTDTKSQNARV